MTVPPLADAAIMLGAHATDWRDAVRMPGARSTRRARPAPSTPTA